MTGCATASVGRLKINLQSQSHNRKFYNRIAPLQREKRQDIKPISARVKNTFFYLSFYFNSYYCLNYCLNYYLNL